MSFLLSRTPIPRCHDPAPYDARRHDGSLEGYRRQRRALFQRAAVLALDPLAAMPVRRGARH